MLNGRVRAKTVKSYGIPSLIVPQTRLISLVRAT